MQLGLGQLTTHFHPRKRQKNYTTPTNKKEKSQLLPELWKSKPKNNLETKILRKWKCKTKMAPEMNTHAVENLSKKTQRTHAKNARKKRKSRLTTSGYEHQHAGTSCSEIRAKYHPNPTRDRWPLESLPLGSETGIQVMAVVGIGDHLGATTSGFSPGPRFCCFRRHHNVYRQSQVRKSTDSGVKWAECSLIIGMGCRVQDFSLILDSSVSLSASIQSAGDLVSGAPGSNPAFSRGTQIVSFRFEYRLPVPEHRN